MASSEYVVRRIAFSGQSEDFEAGEGRPLDGIGASAEGLAGADEGAEDRERGARELSQPLGEARAARPMSVFVPPAVLNEELAVLDLPMPADVGQQLVGCDEVWIEAGHEVARVGKFHLSILRDHVTIDAQENAAAREVEDAAHIVSIRQVEPQLAALYATPFFSTIVAAGWRSCAEPRQFTTASRMSF